MSQDDPGRGASRSPPILVNGMSDHLHGEDMGSSSNVQHYCLRWNNHRSNLLLVFQHLFQTESFTDVTLACEGLSIKCHKMVLAACSSYFQQLFMENSCAHPIVILKDILFYEIKAILEYMYKGEVNINQSQLPGLLRAAEALKVKGLVEDYNQNVGGEPTSTPSSAASSSYQPPPPPPPAPPAPQNSSSSNSSDHHHQQQRSTTPNCSTASKSSNHGNCGSNAAGSSVRFIPGETSSSVFDGHLFNGGNYHEKTSIPTHLWGATRKHSQSPSPKHGSGSSSASNFENEPTPMKRKRVYTGTRDTPILRTVLGHNGHHNTLVGMETVHSPSRYSPHHIPLGTTSHSYKNHQLNMTPNGSNGGIGDLGEREKMKEESPVNFADDWSNRTYESEKTFEEQISDDSNVKLNLTTTYVQPPQKPEWKRYKQYTRADILEAINAVKEGMSALQAARKYGVPSRTLYDKVKKLGITTNRPYKKAGNGGGGTNCVTSTFGKEDSFHYSPESQQLELNAPGPSNGRNGRGMNVVLGLNGMDEDTSSRDHAGSEAECSVKQEPSPENEDEKDDSDHMPPDSSNRSLVHPDGVGGQVIEDIDTST